MQQARRNLLDLEQALDASGLALSASEAHGIITGLSCAAPASGDAAATLEGVVGAFGIDVDAHRELLQALLDMRRDIGERLLGASFEFDPLLPADSDPVPVRVQAVADWCRGFMLGLLQAGVRNAMRLPGDAGEAVADLVEFGSMGVEPGPYDESHEKALAEIREYLRVAVQLICEALHGADGSDAQAT